MNISNVKHCALLFTSFFFDFSGYQVLALIRTILHSHQHGKLCVSWHWTFWSVITSIIGSIACCIANGDTITLPCPPWIQCFVRIHNHTLQCVLSPFHNSCRCVKIKIAFYIEITYIYFFSQSLRKKWIINEAY